MNLHSFQKVFDKLNIAGGVIVATLTMIFGKYWWLFAVYLFLNVLDSTTGTIRARFFLMNESSKAAARGILKKFSYWVVITVAFVCSMTLIQLGECLGFDLSFVMFFGWFTLASYIINELRSIIENANQMGGNAPKWLTRGLEVAGNRVEQVAESIVDNAEKESAGGNDVTDH